MTNVSNRKETNVSTASIPTSASARTNIRYMTLTERTAL